MSDSAKPGKLPANNAVEKGHWFRVCIFFLTGGFFCANVFVEGVEYTTLEALRKTIPAAQS